MAIKREKYGKHENVLVATFGTGDICFSKMAWDGEPLTTLLFHNRPGHKVGEEGDEFKGLSLDEIEAPEFVMEFRNPESITALIHSLIELQKEVFNLDCTNPAE